MCCHVETVEVDCTRLFIIPRTTTLTEHEGTLLGVVYTWMVTWENNSYNFVPLFHPQAV